MSAGYREARIDPIALSVTDPHRAEAYIKKVLRDGGFTDAPVVRTTDVLTGDVVFLQEIDPIEERKP